MLGQLDRFFMMIGADHHRVAEARQHARGVAYRLAAAKLGGSRLEDHARAAQLLHRQREAQAGASRRFLEDHPQHKTVEWPVGVGAPLGPSGARALALLRIAQNRRDGFPAGIRQVEEMAHGHAATGTL